MLISQVLNYLATELFVAAKNGLSVIHSKKRKGRNILEIELSLVEDLCIPVSF